MISEKVKDAWAAFSAGTAKGYAVDIAAELGVAEGELVASGCGHKVVRLDTDWGDLIPRLEDLGEVMILTRNKNVAHEKTGTFGNVSIGGEMGLVLNGDVDLRLFLGRWGHGFAVETQNAKSGRCRSIQFYDHDGTAIHKVFLTGNSNADAYDALVADYRSENQAPGIGVLPPLPKPATRSDDDVDVENLRAHWQRMTDVHQFHSMLKDFNVSRHQGLRLVGRDLAERLEPGSLRIVLESAAQSGLSIMVFVGNGGAIQIHTGPVENIREMGDWINVMDPRFTLHLRNDLIAEAWLVRKPIREGVITTVELYDAEFSNFAILCGERAPKSPENPEWQKLAEGLPRFDGTQAAVAE